MAGEANWPGYSSQGRLDLWYDDVAGTLRASQPVTVSDSERASPLASEEAALDIRANNPVACTTSTGERYLYEGRDLFERFREQSGEIARYLSVLDDQVRSSKRIRRQYRRRGRQRDHAVEALITAVSWEEKMHPIYFSPWERDDFFPHAGIRA